MSGDESGSGLCACVLIPVYDNPRTLADVITGARATGLPVIVVDDGSGEATRAVLDGLRHEPGLTVLEHATNRGKGAALRTGMAAALERGLTHAITMDADGQHLAADLPRLLGAARDQPDALILGQRDLRAAGAGRGSLWGRTNSNFWTWVETGRWLPDTQTGLRVLPLAAIEPLHLRTTGYDLEIELLVKAAWTGTPTASLPVGVRYFSGELRVSHLRPFVDFLRIAKVNTRLVTLRLCLPPPYLALRCTRRFHALSWRARWRETLFELFVREPGSARRIGASVALGLFIGLSPAWGFQGALALLLAHVSGASKTVAFVASNISFPLMIPAVLYTSLVLGRLLIGDASRPLRSLELQSADVAAWVVGSLALGALAALVGGLATWALVSAARRVRSHGS